MLASELLVPGYRILHCLHPLVLDVDVVIVVVEVVVVHLNTARTSLLSVACVAWQSEQELVVRSGPSSSCPQ